MSKNAVIGDADNLNVPVTTVPEELITEEKKMAKYSRSAEFKRLKEFMEARIKFYQHYLPNGSKVEGDPKDGLVGINIPPVLNGDITPYWVAACIVTKEFENVLMEYERAAEATDGREVL